MRRLMFLVVVIFALHSAVWCQNGLVLNQQYAFVPDGGHTFKIATLTADSDSTLDHLHLLATTNAGWGSANNVFLDLTFGNRAGFRYSYTVRGGSPAWQVRVVAYQSADGTVDTYLRFANGFATGGYTVLEAIQDTVYTAPADTLNATPKVRLSSTLQALPTLQLLIPVLRETPD